MPFVKLLCLCSITLLILSCSDNNESSNLKTSRFFADDGEAKDRFGHSVSISGDYVIVGAYLDDSNGFDVGSAYIFMRSGKSWVQQAKLVADDGEAGHYFGYSVSINENYAIVGAHKEDDNGHESGAAYIFVRSGKSWVQQAKLLASDGSENDRFGSSVSIDENYAIVGAWGNNNYQGAAYVFARSGNNWSQQTKLTARDRKVGDRFGYSVAISGTSAVVGAYLDDDNGSDSGAAYVFTCSGNNWSQQTKLLAYDGMSDDYFGASVSISGNYSIVGAYGDDSNKGSAYIFDLSIVSQKSFSKIPLTPFEKKGGLREKTFLKHYRNDELRPHKMQAADGANMFGISVSISGNYAVVGAYGNDNKGTAYIFNLCSTTKNWWAELARWNLGNGVGGDFFSHSVSISENSAVAGAYGENDNQGAAYSFTESSIVSCTE